MKGSYQWQGLHDPDSSGSQKKTASFLRPMWDSWMADLAMNPSPQPGDRVWFRPGLCRVGPSEGEESGPHDPPDQVDYCPVACRSPSKPSQTGCGTNSIFLGIMMLFQQIGTLKDYLIVSFKNYFLIIVQYLTYWNALKLISVSLPSCQNK